MADTPCTTDMIAFRGPHSFMLMARDPKKPVRDQVIEFLASQRITITESILKQLPNE